MEAPEGLTYRTAYWDDPQAKEQFRRFLISIHGLDLGPWDAAGYWNPERYTAFSLFDGDQIVATTNLFSTEMVVDGARLRLGEFSGVGTAPEYRGRGLNRWLTERALATAGPTHDGFFLFADDDAVGFYARCGFVPVAETIGAVDVTVPVPEPGAHRLDAENADDLALLHRLAHERAPVSQRLGVLTPELLMFHFLSTLPDCITYVPDLDVVVCCEVDDGVMTIFDVVGPTVPSFAELHPYLATTPHHEVRWFFMPDEMGVEPDRWTAVDDSGLHVLPPLSLPGPATLLPYTSRA